MFRNLPKNLVVALLLVLQFSCSSGNAPLVKAFKSDNSIQCGSLGVDVDVMALELINAGIDVICAQKGHDGFMRPAVCGADTGNINIYTINTSNLSDAEVLGFESVNVLVDYQDEQCQ